MKSGVVYSEKYLEHELTPGHPENPERLRAIMDTLQERKDLLDEIEIFEPSKAAEEDIELVHDPKYVEKVKEYSKTGERIDLDTPVNEKTFKLALLAAGGTEKLAEKIAKKEFKNGFALIRPPGHHATKGKGGGFCFFNNIAVAAAKLLKEKLAEKILIFDFDSHHGNGTQDIFYNNENVLYLSFHQDGKTLYPGTGFPEEVGGPDAEGQNINIPFTPGSSDKHFAEALKRFFLPISEQFEPDMILVSAGFDPHSNDDLTGLDLSSKAFEMLGNAAINQAKKLCEGKIMFTLEGGYSIESQAESTMRIFERLTNPQPIDLGKGMPDYNFNEIEKAIGPYWDID